MKNIFCLAVAGLALGASAVDMQTVDIYGYRFVGEEAIYTNKADIGKYFSPSNQLVFGKNHPAYRFASDSMATFEAKIADYKILKVIDWRVAYDFEYIKTDNFKLAQEGGDEFTWTIDGGGNWVRILMTLDYKKFHLSYNLDGGSGTFPEERDVNYNKVFNLPEHEPTRTGYTFGGWTNSVNTLFSPNEKVSGITLGVPEGADNVTVVLYPMWEKVEPSPAAIEKTEYYIAFDSNVAEGFMPIVTAKVNAVDTYLPPNKFTRTGPNGWVFEGWTNSTGAAYVDGEHVYSFSPERSGASNIASPGEVVTLYAKWRENAAPAIPVYDDEYSVALNCTNVRWIAEDPDINGGYTNWWVAAESSAVLIMQNHGSGLEHCPSLYATNFPSKGTLKFDWKAIYENITTLNPDDNFQVVVSGNSAEDKTFAIPELAEGVFSSNCTVNVDSPDRKVSLKYLLNTDVGTPNDPKKFRLEISNVVWIPEGAEDTSGMWGIRFSPGEGIEDAAGVMTTISANLGSDIKLPLACGFSRDGYAFDGWSISGVVSSEGMGKWQTKTICATWKRNVAYVVITGALVTVTNQYDGQMWNAPAEFTAVSDNPDYDVSSVRLVKTAEVKGKIYPGVYPRRLTSADFENTNKSWNGRVFFEVVDGYLEIVENSSGGDDSGGGSGDSGDGQDNQEDEIPSDIEVGSTIKWAIPAPDGAKVTLTGLPTGLKYKNGLVTGVPTKSGTFTVKVKTKIGRKTTVEPFKIIKVVAIPKNLVGAYYGFATNVDGIDALASFKLTNMAKLSGSFYDGYQKLSVSGKGFSGRTEDGAYLMDVTCKKGLTKYPATFEFSKTTAGGHDYWSVRAVVPSLAQLEAYRDMIPDVLGSVPTAYVGTWSDYWPGLKVKVAKKGAVTVSGKFALQDGSRVSLSVKPHLVLLSDGTLWCRAALCKKAKGALVVFSEDLEFQ